MPSKKIFEFSFRNHLTELSGEPILVASEKPMSNQKQETLAKMADMMSMNYSRADFALISPEQFCSDMLETLVGSISGPVLNDEEAESLNGMSDYEIKEAVMNLIK
jgi:hypothetical protein